jgi:hypothetical protein
VLTSAMGVRWSDGWLGGPACQRISRSVWVQGDEKDIATWVPGRVCELSFGFIVFIPLLLLIVD